MTDLTAPYNPLLILVGLYLGIGLATYPENAYTYASNIAVNSTYAAEVENTTSEEFDRLIDAQSNANNHTC